MLKKIKERKKLVFGIILYWIVYLSCFFLVEHVIIEPKWIMHCALDDLIPYCKYFLVLYILWFPYIAFTITWYVLHESEKSVISLMKQLGIPMMATLLVYMLFPNGTDVRSKVVLDEGILSKGMEYLWASDPPNNVCPSIHVFVSILLDHALCHATKKNRYLTWISHFLCAGILVSTVMLKQHSVIDVFGGILVAAVVLLYTKKQDSNAEPCGIDS